MNSYQAKKIPLTRILARLGYHPVKSYKGGMELAYRSPFRSENEPSLFVNTAFNIWNDFGDTGGNVLDFIMRLENTDFKGALRYLEQFAGDVSPSTGKNIPSAGLAAAKEGNLRLDKVQALGGEAALVEYLQTNRCIHAALAGPYVKEVHFTSITNGKNYYALGFENLSGGYELRNPFFKGSIGGKDISVISGTGEGALLFEGFMDFLSYLTLEGIAEPPQDCIILNTASFENKAVQLMRAKGYRAIGGYLDNDRKGEEVSRRMEREFGPLYQDERGFYKACKDLNEYLRQKAGHQPAFEL